MQVQKMNPLLRRQDIKIIAMNYFQRRKILRNINTMDLVPVRLRGHEEKDGKIIVMIPKFRNRVYHTLAPFTARMFFRIKLDDLGTNTWQGIDGERNVQQICDYIRTINMEDEQNLTDLDDRLANYIMMLYQRKFISFKQFLNN